MPYFCIPFTYICFHLTSTFDKEPGQRPGRVAQSVGHLTRKLGVLGSIPGRATYFRFSLRFFKKGSCQLLATSAATLLLAEHVAIRLNCGGKKMRRNHSNNVNEKDEKSRPEIRRGNININNIIIVII